MVTDWQCIRDRITQRFYDADRLGIGPVYGGGSDVSGHDLFVTVSVVFNNTRFVGKLEMFEVFGLRIYEVYQGK